VEWTFSPHECANILCVFSKYFLITDTQNDVSRICSAEGQMIMNVLWIRLSERGLKWRHVYKVSAT
jgi:hypothetical protein